MPSPYDYMQNRWLEWHEKWPEPDVESARRQQKLDEIKAKLREIAALLDELEPGDVNPPAPQAG